MVQFNNTPNPADAPIPRNQFNNVKIREIDDLLQSFMFSIHGVPFTGMDLIQTLVYSSYSIWDALTAPEGTAAANGLLFTVNPEKKFVICSLVRFKSDAQKSKDNINTCTMFPENGSLVFALSKGYLVDNIRFKEPKEDTEMDFVMHETGDLMLEEKHFKRMLGLPKFSNILPKKREYNFL